jgi:predicted phage tail protein
MKKLTHITLHGILSEQIGRQNFDLAVSSVGEAMRGIQANCKKLYKSLIENDEKNIKYRVLINKKDFLVEEGKDLNTEEGIRSSELTMNFQDLKTIDIVPVMEGESSQERKADSKSIFAIIAGIFLIALGIWMGGNPYLIMAGLGLLLAGVSNLLTPTPKFEDVREIEGGGKPSYMFSGPQNTVREGGPVFVGYGRLLVGSHVIQTSLDTLDTAADIILNDTWGMSTYGLLYRINNPSGGERLRRRVQHDSDWTGGPTG